MAGKHREGGGAEAEGEESKDDSRMLRNAFNYSERASQTQNNPMRDRSTYTEPPPMASINAASNQWEIFDAYMTDQDNARLQKEAHLKLKKEKEGKEEEAKNPDAHAKKGPSASKKNKDKDDVLHGPPMARAVKVMERMVNQNLFDDIAQDFKVSGATDWPTGDRCGLDGWLTA